MMLANCGHLAPGNQLTTVMLRVLPVFAALLFVIIMQILDAMLAWELFGHCILRLREKGDTVMLAVLPWLKYIFLYETGLFTLHLPFFQRPHGHNPAVSTTLSFLVIQTHARLPYRVTYIFLSSS